MDDKLLQAQEAADLLASDAWKRAYTAARNHLFKQWEAAGSPDVREQVWHTLKALDQVKTALVSEASQVSVNKMQAQAKG